jgi:hypothetical protein
MSSWTLQQPKLRYHLLSTTYGIWSKTKSITAETHDLTWKTPPMRRGKTTGTSQQQSHYLKRLGYTPMAAYKRIKSPRNPSKGISATLRQKPGLYLAVNLEQLQQHVCWSDCSGSFFLPCSVACFEWWNSLEKCLLLVHFSIKFINR